MPDHLLAELKATLQSLGSALHMLRQQDADPHAIAFVCGGAEQRLRDVLAGLAPAPMRTKRRVLIADPERGWTGALAQALSENGHQVRAAATADEALARAAGGFEPEIVLLDLAMGQTYDLVRKLRGDEPRPVVVAITGWNRASDRSLAHHAGVAHYLTKPVSPEAVVDLVATLP